MIDPKILDQLATRFIKALPDGLEQLSDDLGQNLKAAFAAALSRADIVTREEFDVQSSVLTRTREKLTELEKTVAKLEHGLARDATEEGGN